MATPSHIQYFKEDISGITLPNKFTYPFYYEPHILCRLAVKQVQQYIEEQQDWKHPFTKNNAFDEKAIGKMFGVLVVQLPNKQIGFISAFSGKLAGTNNHSYFVPPVFDMLQEQSYFLKEEETLNLLNQEINKRKTAPHFLYLQEQLQLLQQTSATEIENLRLQIIEDRKLRKQKRNKATQHLEETQLSLYIDKLAKESIAAKTALRKLTESWEKKILNVQEKIRPLQQEIDALKKERKEKSNALQKYLFQQYLFINQDGEIKNLLHIFKQTAFETPPAGAGECAAPKLLQYAFLNQLTPVCMAEFWWGDSPKSEIRKHGNYYPACQGKCKPILGHMLKGIPMENNPLLNNPAIGKEIAIVYEDPMLLVVNKPAEFLSVPGKTIDDSVYLRMKQKYPKATGPLIVHRLDMSTSGLMLIAKTKEIHAQLQQQFIKRTVQKRYVALLDGIPQKEEEYIDLPLRLDLEDRPRQLVCYEHGKTARTRWEILAKKEGKARVYFYPITGRTHQLRVHAAHSLGLKTPIVGDDLYGKKSNRLHLHAESITFIHPISQKEISIQVNPDF